MFLYSGTLSSSTHFFNVRKHFKVLLLVSKESLNLDVCIQVTLFRNDSKFPQCFHECGLIVSSTLIQCTVQAPLSSALFKHSYSASNTLNSSTCSCIFKSVSMVTVKLLLTIIFSLKLIFSKHFDEFWCEY